MFLSSVHVFRCHRDGVMGAILPPSLAKRLALQVSVVKSI